MDRVREHAKKEANDNFIEWPVAFRRGLGGAAVGASAAAILNLVHMLREMHEERNRRRKGKEDPGTITLTLPPKRAEDLCGVKNSPSEPAHIAKRITTKVTLTTGPKHSSQYMRPDGDYIRFGPATKKSQEQPVQPAKPAPVRSTFGHGWPTDTASILMILAGSGIGAHVVNKVYEARKRRMLKSELNAAKQEYMDLLEGRSVKGAEWLDDLFDVSGMDKFAQSNPGRVYGILNTPLTALALLYLLGSAGTGYITKRVLDEATEQEREKGLDIPKLERVVFRSRQLPADTEEEKRATAEDLRGIQTAIAIMMDKLSGTRDILGTPEVVVELKKAGTSADALIKMAQEQDFISQIMPFLLKHPQLGNIIRQKAVSRAPILGRLGGFGQWASRLPGVSGYIDKQITNRGTAAIRQALQNPEFMSLLAQRGLGAFGGKMMPQRRKAAPSGPTSRRGTAVAGAGESLIDWARDPIRSIGRFANKPTVGGAGRVAWEGAKAIPKLFTAPVRSAYHGLRGLLRPGVHSYRNYTLSKNSMQRKQAVIGGLLTADILADVAGGKIMEKSITRKLRRTIREEARKDRDSPEQGVKGIELVAKDPQAQAYLQANKSKIMKVLRRMALQGHLNLG